jgi:hypothetical protein
MESNMSKLFISATVIASLLCSFATASFAGGTAQEQQDCTGDALRLCGQFVPNEQAITACMFKKKANLSPACKKHFTSSK